MTAGGRLLLWHDVTSPLPQLRLLQWVFGGGVSSAAVVSFGTRCDFGASSAAATPVNLRRRCFSATVVSFGRWVFGVDPVRVLITVGWDLL